MEKSGFTILWLKALEAGGVFGEPAAYSEIRMIVGIDVGGANLKYCSASGTAIANNFPLWRYSDQLADVIRNDLKGFDKIEALVVTMTGELADCFADRRVGVHHIVKHVMHAAGKCSIETVVFYGVDGRFASADHVVDSPDKFAAANWHALGSHLGQIYPDAGLVVDVGSTTTDIIPLRNQHVATEAVTDFDRLREGSLVYIGCRRTPICAIVDTMNFDGSVVPVMNEFFATIDDAMILTKHTAEAETDIDTADGRPRTTYDAANRIARMIGLDHRSVSIEQAIELGKQVVHAAQERIGRQIEKLDRGRPIVLTGHGCDLIELDSERKFYRLTDDVGESISRVAPAYALACQYQNSLLPRASQ